MFQVSLTNFGTYFPQTFATFEAAIAFAKSKGYSATIHDLANGGVAGAWDVFGGCCDWRAANAAFVPDAD